ncbi:conserved hypothetical protein [Culex quinquefasciatus]|uniref:Chitin-binding type-2 domain-containing protein n=1 Tax=Culex quinquefasciatus TaxID=7176 RepID=B0WLE9_CULQU|nr:peritrophin-1 [Culex quinquefasciatus]EDS30442.1 conserved hypothetical protein [Culex quinquefasciatus]|eukprot:XP_001849533.1 conserved hypothetical protein [Culex quinquefasciatus]
MKVLALCFVIAAVGVAAVPQYYQPQWQQQQWEQQQWQQQMQWPQQQQQQMSPDGYRIVPGVVDTRCPRMDDPINPTHLPVNGDCRKFMKCYGGRAYEHECPAGLEFGIQVNRCDYPELARCSFNYGW